MEKFLPQFKFCVFQTFLIKTVIYRYVYVFCQNYNNFIATRWYKLAFEYRGD